MANFIKDIAFFTGDCSSCLSTCESASSCPTNFTHMTSIYRSECNELFIACTWDDKPINCCQTFKPISTEYGVCYSMNNNHVSGNLRLFYVASANRRRLGSLEVIISEDYEAFLHSHEDVPFWNMEHDRRIILQKGSHVTVVYSITDVVNEPEVSLTAPEVRQCRFPEEIPPNFVGFDHYSYSVCIIQCRIKAQLELCDCTDHLSPVEYKSHYCDLEGLKCLTKHYEKLRKLKVPGLNDTGLNCDCSPSCVEPDYNIVAKRFISQKETRGGRVKFVLSNRPYERVTRQVARTTLDLVVAMGNCFGLCFGGSILSIMEVLYYLCLKSWKYSK
ncbi:pickpocket protein 11-like [Epargyreus clarus]|uniref:pickpocket protein 11-like n=1 Tax=Epargyreus clarus TaxID=520877 RepID=UPI003C306CCD